MPTFYRWVCEFDKIRNRLQPLPPGAVAAPRGCSRCQSRRARASEHRRPRRSVRAGRSRSEDRVHALSCSRISRRIVNASERQGDSVSFRVQFRRIEKRRKTAAIIEEHFLRDDRDSGSFKAQMVRGEKSVTKVRFLRVFFYMSL